MKTFGEGFNRSCKYGKLDCPCFDGENFNGWLMKFEQFFEAKKVQEEAKVRTIMM